MPSSFLACSREVEPRSGSIRLYYSDLWNRYHLCGSDSIPRKYTSLKFRLSRRFLRIDVSMLSGNSRIRCGWIMDDWLKWPFISASPINRIDLVFEPAPLRAMNSRRSSLRGYGSPRDPENLLLHRLTGREVLCQSCVNDFCRF
jgi:hypothetical protein